MAFQINTHLQLIDFFHYGTGSYTFIAHEVELLNIVLKNKLLRHFWYKHNQTVHLSPVWQINQSTLLRLPKNTHTTAH